MSYTAIYFKHLKMLQNNVLTFSKRWYKEYGNSNCLVENIIEYFRLDENNVNDLIDLIMYYGEIDIETLIFDYNMSNHKHIKTKHELINDILKVYNVWQMLYNPIGHLFFWRETSKGFVFYANLSQIMIKQLKLCDLCQFFIQQSQL
jgi:hypothetical protein